MAHRGSRGAGPRNRPLRLVVVEPVTQPQALIEPWLGVGRGRGDLVRVAAEGIVENGAGVAQMTAMVSARLTLHGSVLALHRAAARDEKRRGEDDRQPRSH